MSKLKKFCLILVSLFSVICLTAGIGLQNVKADDDPEVGYNDKLIARYTLDETTEETVEEVTTNYFNAIDNEGNPLADMKAVTTASIAVNAMEGRGAGNFSSGNMVIPAFLSSEATGFSISGWMINQAGDWNTLFRYGEVAFAAGTGEIGLPNVTYRIAEAPGFTNTVPGDANKINGGQWDNFINNNTPITSNNLNEYMYITVSIDAVNGITYYKDGVALIHYPTTHALHITPYTVNDIVTTSIEAAKNSGIVFGDGNIARFDDLRISQLLSDEEVIEQYNNSTSLNISKIITGGIDFKEFNYDQVSAGIAYDSPEYVVNYLKDFEDAEGDLNNNLEPEITFEVSTISSENSEGVFGSLSLVNASEYTVTMTSTTPETVGDLTSYYKTYTITRGDLTKLIRIKFIKNNSIVEARKALSGLRIDGVLVEGFAGEIKDYAYNLAPTVTAIPEVTYTAMIPEDVTITDNKEDVFDGVEFVYTIEISYESAVISTYTVTFTRASSAIASTLTIDSNGIYNFKGNVFYDEGAGTGEQNAYVKTAITDISKISMTMLYETAELVVPKSSIDVGTKDITLVIKDTVSNLEKTYYINQIEYNEDMLEKTVVFGSGEGYTIKGSAADEAGYVNLGATGYIDIPNFLEDVDSINPDGITLTTWMRMPASATNTWSGIFTLTQSSGTIIVNNNMILTGDYPLNGAWTNDGFADNSDRFKSNVYKLVVLQISQGKAVLFVDGAVIAVKDSRITVSATSDIALGRSHVTDPTKLELLGSGYYKDFRVYNAPISVASINDIVAEQESSLLTSLKFVGATSNVPNFSGKSFSYELEYSSDKTTPVAADFPKLVAANGAGIIPDAKIVAGAVTGKSIIYTITSEANGFTNVYTVKVSLVDNNTDIEELSVLYAGKKDDFSKALTLSDFELIDGKMVTTIKVWKGADLSDFVIDFTLASGQTSENESLTDTSYSVDVYAEDGSYVTYVVNFEVDKSVSNPDGEKSNLGMILGIVFGSIGGVVVIGGGIVLGIYFNKKSQKSKKEQ